MPLDEPPSKRPRLFEPDGFTSATPRRPQLRPAVFENAFPLQMFKPQAVTPKKPLIQARFSAPPRFLPPDASVAPSPSKRRIDSASRIPLAKKIPTTSKVTLPVTTPKKPLSTSVVTPVKNAFAFNQLSNKKPGSSGGLKTTPAFTLETPKKRPMTPVRPPPPQFLEAAAANPPRQKERTTISSTRIATVMDPSTEAGSLEVTTLFMDRLGYKGLVGPEPVRGLEVSPEKGSRRARKFVRGGMAEYTKAFYSRQETTDSLWQTELQSLSNTKPDLRVHSPEILTRTPQSVLVKGFIRQRSRGDQKETRVMLPLVAEPALRTANGLEVFQPWSAIGDVIFCTRYRIMK
ncbi:hypothetical protein BJ322DRAFT_558820 [Thelephora terrestris]|uniref:Uncharacterized protein n=1 Tax=Thelephora terrestris TaxID=56493 RepID=A0A9P6HLS6_9AGAM|nr:hypothetical protein BJ322DRAFT_558820 [Thelephora terrestris]